MAVKSGQEEKFEKKSLMYPERFEKIAVFPTSKGKEGQGDAIVRISDITEEKRIDDQLIRADRLSSLGQLSGGIAHEIKNPLTGIRLFTDLLSDENKFKLDAGGVDILNEIKDNVDKIDGIIKRVLDFARPTSISLKKVDINTIIQENVKLWSAKFRKSNIRVKFSLDENLSKVKGDSISLQQLINNLVLNAIEAMDKGGLLEITTLKAKSTFHRDRNVVTIGVKDTGGHGIAPENVKNIFNPFFTTKASGTGLGLAISHKIIERHGGVILLDSKPGKGTTFTIEFPCLSEK